MEPLRPGRQPEPPAEPDPAPEPPPQPEPSEPLPEDLPVEALPQLIETPDPVAPIAEVEQPIPVPLSDVKPRPRPVDRVAATPVDSPTDAPEIADGGADALSMVHTLEVHGLLDRAMSGLPPQQRIALILSYHDDLSNPEIAQVMDTTERAAQVVTALFSMYLERLDEWPHSPLKDRQPARAVADYIAGMTDRFAIREHQRLSGRVLFP